MEKGIINITSIEALKGLKLDLNTGRFYDDVENKDVMKLLKQVFTNKARFKSRFVDLLNSIKDRIDAFPNFPDGFFDNLGEDDYYEFVRYIDYNKMPYEEVEAYWDKMEKEHGITYDIQDNSVFECEALMNELLDMYDDATPFTYEEAFKIENEEFQAMVFGTIDIVDMIKELGSERIKTAGKRVKHKDFSASGEFLGMKEYDVVYETHKVDCNKLGLEEDAYALRCWCTTTDKEHWLWIEDQYKDDPLEAVASTMRVHENIIPHIKEIKRQGDILLVETGDVDIKPEGEMVPLTAEQYFGFLTAQS